MNSIHPKAMIAWLVLWLKAEPVVASVLAADALTVAAHFGVHLDAGNTLVLGAIATAIATWAARRQVTAGPTPSAAPAIMEARSAQPAGIVIINKSTMASSVAVQAAAAACSVQIGQHVAPAWGRVPMPVTFGSSAAVGCLPIFVFDHADQAGALGFHDETPDGRQYGKVFVADCQKAGVSLSSVISHEVCEAFIDPSCNLWADTGKHTAIALEVGDPVEDGSYTVNVNGRLTEVSNFVLPAWFDPRHTGGKVDWLGQLAAPFTRTGGGYVIIEKEGAVTQQFGRAYSRARRTTKKHPAARTARRSTQGA